MPQIGEQKKGKDIGKAGKWNFYVWLQCPQCKCERWVYKKKYTHWGWCQRCLKQFQSKENHWNWKGGRYRHHHGYIVMQLEKDDPFYPMAYKGYIFEHRYNMARQVGRCLLSEETVHHKNGIKDDNRLENLELVMNQVHRGIIRCPYCKEEFLIQ